MSKNDSVEEQPSATGARSADPRPRFTRVIEIDQAYDKRHADPKQNYGIHGVTMRFVLKGEKGATQFLLYTNWQLPHVTEETNQRTLTKARAGMLDEVDLRVLYLPMAADRGYHSPVPMFEGQSSMGRCPLLDGRECYYDGSGLQADVVYRALLTEGGEGVWRELEYYYQQVFDADPS